MNKKGPVQMLSCFDVAKYFLTRADEVANNLIPNLKLQRLVYYAQGFHIALYDKPLFPERIEAWEYGPVVPDLFHVYKHCGEGSIPPPVDVDISKFDKRIRELLDRVYSVYGHLSAWELWNTTYQEAPWKTIYEYGNHKEISHQLLAGHFKNQLEVK